MVEGNKLLLNLLLLSGLHISEAFTVSSKIDLQTATVGRKCPTTKRYMSSTAGENEIMDVDVLVVGSGVSGSTLAFHLFKNHNVDSVLLTERNPVVGGNVISKVNDGEKTLSYA
jgi:ribulose 1,5-bisphosphate synthetase/thiazole synthase